MENIQLLEVREYSVHTRVIGAKFEQHVGRGDEVSAEAIDSVRSLNCGTITLELSREHQLGGDYWQVILMKDNNSLQPTNLVLCVKLDEHELGGEGLGRVYFPEGIDTPRILIYMRHIKDMIVSGFDAGKILLQTQILYKLYSRTEVAEVTEEPSGEESL